MARKRSGKKATTSKSKMRTTNQTKGIHSFRPEHTASVSKGFRAEILQQLEAFDSRADEKAYTFKTSMSKQQRAMVHLLSRKMDMISKSSGKGEQRYVTVCKTDKKRERKQTEKKRGGKSEKNSKESTKRKHISSFAFSEESKRVLMDLFMHYPPGEDKIGGENLHDQTRNTDKSRGGIDDTFLRPVMSKAEIASKVKSLRSKVQRTPKLAEIFQTRSKLPIASFQDTITSTIANHQVVLICGETGCGKTTQVPQYLLDHMWAKGEACKIICTQPRRISAISVSERIAQERAENIGDSVGYKIRLESKGGRQSSILFCTAGVLLRVLVSSRESGSGASRAKAEKCISELTHIVVDEIHERDRFSDFMLTILRDLLPAHPHLRLVLMSATIDAERFSEYFGGCPVVRVPGFTHPVRSFHLEEVLSMLNTLERNHLSATPTLPPTCPSNEPKLSKEYQVALDEAIELSLLNEEFHSLLDLIISSEGKPEVLNHKHSSTGVTPLMIFAGKGRMRDICTLLSLGVDSHIKARDGTTALDWAKRGGQTEAAEVIKKYMEASSSGSNEEQQLLQKYMKYANPDVIDCVLVEKLLKKICMESKDGAILVFLPGWEDISRTQRTLLDANSFFSDTSRFSVLPLHSMVPAAEQKKVFQKPPRGCRKIILSTNIAETSVTIDDVVYVIDSGRMKEKNYDPLSNVSTLQSSWISKASAKQREGRAGRCQPGVCYHLYSKLKAVSLADFQVPEIKRMPIEELCLQVKMLDPNSKVVEFLNKTLDPPVLETINNAIAVLQDIGALSLDEQLTDLGKKLGSLPVHPLTSRMLFLAILLNCLEPALTLACAADYRDPFTLPILPTDKHKADIARAKFASLYGGQSDQLATVAAFDCWERAKGKGRDARFCSENYISRNIMSMLSGMRKQLLNELKRGGFVPSDVSTCNLNSRDPGIVQAVLVAGLYPRVGRLGSRPKAGQRSKGDGQTLVETSSGLRARLPSRSMLSKLSSDQRYNEHGQGPLLLYDEVTRGDSGLQVRSCTVISPLPLMLLAKEIAVKEAPGEGKENGPAEKDGKSDSLADGDKKDSDSPADCDKKDIAVEKASVEVKENDPAEKDGKSDSSADGDEKDSDSPADDDKKDIAVNKASGEGKENDPAQKDGKSDSPADGDKKDTDSPVDGDKKGSDEGQTGSLKDTSEEGIMKLPENSVIVVVDGWVSFKVTALEVAQICCLRERLSAAILFRISNPAKVLPPPLVASTYAVACLMSYDGLTGVSLPTGAPPVGVDILTSLANAPDVKKKKKRLPMASNNLRTSIAAHGSSGESSSNAQAKDVVVNTSSSRETIPPVTAPPPREEPISGRPLLVRPPSVPKDVVVKPSSSRKIIPPLIAPPPQETPISGQPLLVGPPPREREISGWPLLVRPPPVPKDVVVNPSSSREIIPPLIAPSSQETPISGRPLLVGPPPVLKDVVNPSLSRETIPPLTAPPPREEPISRRPLLVGPLPVPKDVMVNPSSSREIIPPLTVPPPLERPISGRPSLVGPSARRRPISRRPSLVGPSPVPPQPMIGPQPNGGTVQNEPCVQASATALNKKRKRKNKANSHVSKRGVANPGLGALLSVVGSNPFGPYGPRGR